jgi:hypothetical protein
VDHAPQRFTAEELQAALGDKPFVVRDMWQGQPPSAGPSPDPDAPELRQAAEAVELRQPAARSDPALPEQGFAADLAAESRPTKARRWPLVALAAASLAGACVAVLWLIAIGAPPRGTQRTATASLALNATNPTPATFAPEASAPVLPSDPAAATAPPPEVPPPAEPPTTGAPPVAAVDAFATPDTPRPSNPILAAALLQRAEDALARKDIAAAAPSSSAPLPSIPGRPRPRSAPARPTTPASSNHSGRAAGWPTPPRRGSGTTARCASAIPRRRSWRGASAKGDEPPQQPPRAIDPRLIEPLPPRQD